MTSTGLRSWRIYVSVIRKIIRVVRLAIAFRRDALIIVCRSFVCIVFPNLRFIWSIVFTLLLLFVSSFALEFVWFVNAVRRPNLGRLFVNIFGLMHLDAHHQFIELILVFIDFESWVKSFSLYWWEEKKICGIAYMMAADKFIFNAPWFLCLVKFLGLKDALKSLTDWLHILRLIGFIKFLQISFIRIRVRLITSRESLSISSFSP